MGLSSELVSQFAKITNDKEKKKNEEVTLYGEVYEYEDMICVKFDGSEELTPVTTVVEKDESGNIVNYKYGAASVKTGDRVSVSLKNHSATITGNLSDPPAGRAEFIVNSDSIIARVAKTELWIKEDGVTFKGLADGTTVINGGCIQTGTIDAQYLNLTGAISFTDLTQEVQDDLTALEDTADEALSTATHADDIADIARDLAKSIANGQYLKGTFIDGKSIKSPTIEGNEINVYGTFQTIGNDSVGMATTGYMGAAQGMDADGNTTFGVALSYTWNEADYSVGDNYVIVTNGGVRLQSGDNRIILTPNSIRINTGSSKAYYNDEELGSGSGGSGGTVVAVWG